MKRSIILEGTNSDFKGNYAGPKARQDLIDILLREGYEVNYIIGSKNQEKQLLHFFDIKRLCDNADCVILQYPFAVDSKFYRGMTKFLLSRKSVLWLHDIGSLRNESGNQQVKKEINLFNKFEFIVSHNKYMTQWLKSNGAKSKIVDLEMFDYLVANKSEASPINIENVSCDRHVVHFAGNLSREKSEFIYSGLAKMSRLHIKLYGNNFDSHFENSQLDYQGSYPPDILPLKLQGGFGLVWDGNSVTTCDGNYGRYLRFNNPHKTSLYLAAGIPVVVWDKAAVADFVIREKVGITISSLEEMQATLEKITEQDYIQLRNNAKQISNKLKSGYYSKQVLKTIRSAAGNNV